MSMPGNKVSSHPLETLNGVRGVHEVSNTLAWLAEELTSRNENYNTIIVPGGGLVEESRGKGSWTGLLYVNNIECDELSDRRSMDLSASRPTKVKRWLCGGL